ncbi:MAG: squalene synthase HpnC [Ideonella sp.]|nr:squalene synthase HpnC [Ideonella sp.]
MSVDHYENFPVASWLCPPALRPAVRAIYAFARTADDLADEGTATRDERLAALTAYERDLHAACAGQALSPRWREVFVPLGPVIARHRLPPVLFTDLLDAFRQDLTQTRYADRAQLLDYCRRSANPVGRLLLHLYGVADAQALRKSDAICSSLQLANFWQDLSIDTARGRLYIPRADCERHGVAAADLLARRDSPMARALIGEMVAWTRRLMLEGAPLVHRVAGRAGWELRLVVQGGLRILQRIEQRGFDALLQRPCLHWHDAPTLAWRALRMRPAAARALEEPAR